MKDQLEKIKEEALDVVQFHGDESPQDCARYGRRFLRAFRSGAPGLDTPDALAAVDILHVILREEVGHVAIGNHWYKQQCALAGREPVACYAELAARYQAPRLRGPFNLEARRAAGFDDDELAALQDG